MFHEYAHGIANRLVGPGACLATHLETPSEGISDFYALVLSDIDGKAEDRAIGEWAFGRNIRAYKYSRNMVVNPTTYNSIAKEDPLYRSNASTVQYLANTSSCSFQHFVGSVFGAVAWDIYLQLRDEYGWTPFTKDHLETFAPVHVAPEDKEIPFPDCVGKKVLYTEPFEEGLGEWATGSYNVQDPTSMKGHDWSFTKNLPENSNSRGAAYVDSPQGILPYCESETAVRYLQSPVMSYYSENLFVSFHHYHDTEEYWDGGI